MLGEWWQRHAARKRLRYAEKQANGEPTKNKRRGAKPDPFYAGKDADKTAEEVLAADPDISGKAFDDAMAAEWQKTVEISDTAEKRAAKEETRGQSDSGEWHRLRRLVIPSTRFYNVATRKDTMPCHALVLAFVYAANTNLGEMDGPVKYGNDNEAVAVQKYVDEVESKLPADEQRQ
ncbi:uncharacterized protein LOC117642052 [Thrips palmi]|uniref:Uncharacterized protein LOC117642052 n=1 Tax=Thrips palmi TaxID=161013 RepID=A0A6P8YGS5_THRPL|nr:uncharacterized protein LOC117642052 [Thrips palmi]